MGCLALNASYEPLTMIPARRAIRLILDRKAEVLEGGCEARLPITSHPTSLSDRHQARELRPCSATFPSPGHEHLSLRSRQLHVSVLWAA